MHSIPRHAARLTLWTLAVVCACGGGRVAAQSDERVTLRVDGRSVLRLGSTDDLEARERVARIERRIATLLERPEALRPPRVETPQTRPEDRLITVSGVSVMTITTADAEDNVASVDDLAKQWAEALQRSLDRAASRRLSAGGRFTSEVQASIEAAFGRLGDSAVKIVPRALAALLVLTAFWALASLVRWLMRLIFHRYIEDVTVENLIKQLAYYAVWVLGLAVAVDAFGLDPQTVVTGLGLTGLALGFALRDILSNFVSGLLILTFRSFRIGDQIIVGDAEGSVERIELRATQIRSYDGRAVLVPNAELLTSRIINNTAGPVLRASIVIVLGYDVSVDSVRAALLDAMAAVEGVLADPSPSVRIRDLLAEGIRFEGRFWTDSRRSDYLATSSRVAEVVLARLAERNVPLPQPAERLLSPTKLDDWRKLLTCAEDERAVGEDNQETRA